MHKCKHLRIKENHGFMRIQICMHVQYIYARIMRVVDMMGIDVAAPFRTWVWQICSQTRHMALTQSPIPHAHASNLQVKRRFA
jgi:hypothetical protein